MTDSLDDLLRSAIREDAFRLRPPAFTTARGLTADAIRAALDAPPRPPEYVFHPRVYAEAQRLLGKEGQRLTLTDMYEAARIEIEQDRAERRPDEHQEGSTAT